MAFSRMHDIDIDEACTYECLGHCETVAETMRGLDWKWRSVRDSLEEVELALYTAGVTHSQPQQLFTAPDEER